MQKGDKAKSLSTAALSHVRLSEILRSLILCRLQPMLGENLSADKHHWN